jgi:hypothetical protein
LDLIDWRIASLTAIISDASTPTINEKDIADERSTDELGS